MDVGAGRGTTGPVTSKLRFHCSGLQSGHLSIIFDILL